MKLEWKIESNTLKQFLNKSEFSIMVERSVHEKRVSYIDAIVDICNDNQIELEDVGKYVNSIVKDKIEAEARSLNCLDAPKINTLPI
jgi:hypothetical protein|tara:strand:- start:221 stop:481 length:261 start_codon:yes stop_codon:yes gene_type:complete